MANSAGDAFINVRPDLSDFGQSLGKSVDPHIDKAASGITTKLGGAFRGVASIAAGIGAGVAIGGFFKGAFAEAEEARKTLAQTNAVLKSTGGEAGITADGVGRLASKLSALTGIDDDAIASTENLLLTFTNIHNEAGKGNDIFDQTTQSVIDMSTALGTDAKGAAIQLGKALNDPVKGVGALAEVGVTFTEQQKEQIKTLVESGKTLDAQKIILAEINKEFGGSAAAAASPMAKLKVAFGNLQEQVGSALLPTLSKAATFLADRLPGAAETAGQVLSKIGTAVKGVFEILVKRDFSGILAKAFNIQEDAPIVGTLFRLRDTVIGVFKTVREAIQLFVIGFKNPEVGVAVDSWQGALVRLGQVIKTVFDFIRDNAKPILIGLGVAFVALTAPITGTIAALVLAYARFDGFRTVVNTVVKTVLDQLGNLVSWFKTVWPQIQEAVGHVVEAVKAIWRTFGDEIVSVAKTMWEQVRNIVQTAVDLVRGVITTVLALINGDWGKAWDGIKGILSTAWEYIRETVANALTIVREVLEAGMDVVRGAWTRAWNGVKDFLGGVWDAVVGVARGGIAKVVDVFLGLVETILKGAARAFGWIPGIGGKLKDAARGFEEFRDEVNEKLSGIDGVIPLSADASKFWAEFNAVESAARNANAVTEQATGAGTSGPQQFAQGFDVGPVGGPLGKPRLVVAHGGEWIGTPEQMEDLASGRSGGGTGGLDAGTMQQLVAILQHLADHPIRAYTVASDVSRGQVQLARRYQH